MLGPVGPLKKDSCRSPHRPSKASHGKACHGRPPARSARRRPRGRSPPAVGSCRRSRDPQSLVRGRACDSKWFACEPAAGYTTGWVPSTMLELVVVPACPLTAAVLAVADRDRIRLQRLLRRTDVEDQPNRLPVALVGVVVVVEDVEEPVLQRELSGTRRVVASHTHTPSARYAALIRADHSA